MYIAWTYFPDSKSTVTGFLLFFAGLSTLILAPLTTWIVNPNNLLPNNKDYNEKVIGNVPTMWYVISGLHAILFIISVILQPDEWDADKEAEKRRKIKLKETK